MDLVKRAADYRSAASAVSKFNSFCGGMSPPFRRYGSWDEYVRERTYHVEGTTSLVLFKISQLSRPRVELDHEFLVEALAYDDGIAHLIVTRRRGSAVALDLPHRPHPEAVRSVTFGAFYSDDEPYRTFMLEFAAHYLALPCDVPTSVFISWFGDRPCPLEPNPRLVIDEKPRAAFHESIACNTLVRYAAGSHLFRLDGDTFLTKGQVREVLTAARKRPSHAVWNLKSTPQTGPGILFGHRATMARNPYDETFPAPFYHVDTAHLLSYSRRGIVPTVLFVPSMRRDEHERPLAYMQQANWPAMCKVLAGADTAGERVAA